MGAEPDHNNQYQSDTEDQQLVIELEEYLIVERAHAVPSESASFDHIRPPRPTHLTDATGQLHFLSCH